MAAKTKSPISKAHMVTGGIALVVVVVVIWALNNVSFVSDNAKKVGVQV